MSVPGSAPPGGGASADAAGTIGAPPHAISGPLSAGQRMTTTFVAQTALASRSPGRRTGEDMRRAPSSPEENYLLSDGESSFLTRHSRPPTSPPRPGPAPGNGSHRASGASPVPRGEDTPDPHPA